MKKKTDPHILVLQEHCIKTANLIPQVIVNKSSVSDADKERYNNDLPALIERIKKAPLWDGHLTFIKKKLDAALMWAAQVDSKPSTPYANAYYGKYVAKTPRMILEAEYVEDADKTLRRLPMDDIRAICPMAGCGKFLLYRDKHGNVPVGRKKADVCYKHSRAKAAQAMALQAHRKEKAASRKKTARRKDKENRGKPDPKYVKDMEERKRKLREKERKAGAPSREERRKSRGF